MRLKYLSSPYAILMRFGICSLRETLGPDRIYRPKYIATPEMEQLAKDPTAYPILADCVEEAGCDYQAALDHLRADHHHYPTCWAAREVTKTRRFSGW